MSFFARAARKMNERRHGRHRKLVVERLESRELLAGDVYLVNFQLAGADTPNRFLADTGNVFAPRGNGFTYGWSSDHTDQSRDRGVNLDQRLDTLIHIEVNASWEFQLPNGKYQVTASIGDALNPSTHTLNVEGINLFNAVPLAANAFQQATVTVTVNDGRLTLNSGAAPDKATRINFVYIVGVPSAANGAPAAPTIMEPSTAGQIVNPSDVHMEAIGFSDPDGNAHANTDWEIWTADAGGQPVELVWTTIGIGGVERLHTHLGDGILIGSHAGMAELKYSTNYLFRVRFRDNAGSVSSWATRTFSTGALTEAFPMQLEDIGASPAPSWIDQLGASIILPAPSGTKPRLSIESWTGELLLSISGNNGAANAIVNPAALSEHVDARVAVSGGASGVNLTESDLKFADAHGAEYTIFLPAMSVAPNTTAYFWVAADGATYYGQAGQTEPDFSNLARSSLLGFATLEPGYRVEVVAEGLQLPINIAFVPNPGSAPNSPKYYITELYGQVKVVYNDGSVHDYATGLLNYNPTGNFPGSGEQGVAGIVVEPVTGDLIISRVREAANGTHYPQVVRLHSTDGGRTASSTTVLLDMVGETQGQSHQISDISLGPDGKLYVHNGDGFDASTALNLNSFRGKILRINLDGSAPADNPFYNAANGITATDYIYAYGFRNPFGGAWRAGDGKLYEVENGPGSNDRLAKVTAGTNYGWNGSAGSMTVNATYNWPIPHAPVDIAFVQPQTFGGSQFPSANQGVAFVTESGPTWATGPQTQGKRIVKFNLGPNGELIDGPTTFVEYVGQGKASIGGIVAGPDGLYFTDIYPDLNFQDPTAAEARVLRIRYVGESHGQASFTANEVVGPTPLTVKFTDTSTTTGVTDWLWSFGDGGTSTAPSPTHVYSTPGVYSVSLTISGEHGIQAATNPNFIVAGYEPEDTNQDGVVNHSVDVPNLVSGWNTDTAPLTTQSKLLAGDNNLDGKVDLFDAFRLRRALLNAQQPGSAAAPTKEIASDAEILPDTQKSNSNATQAEPTVPTNEPFDLELPAHPASNVAAGDEVFNSLGAMEQASPIMPAPQALDEVAVVASSQRHERRDDRDTSPDDFRAFADSRPLHPGSTREWLSRSSRAVVFDRFEKSSFLIQAPLMIDAIDKRLKHKERDVIESAQLRPLEKQGTHRSMLSALDEGTLQSRRIDSVRQDAHIVLGSCFAG